MERVVKFLKQGCRNPTGFRRWVKVAKNQKLLYIHGMGTWKSKNRHKYPLQYHIIFVCKYRKKLLVSRQISDDIKQFSYEIYQTIYGKDILNIYENNSGKNIPFGQMDILPVVQEMYRKKC